LSEGEQYTGKSTYHLTRWNYPDGHNHPSGGVINPKQQIILSALKVVTNVTRDVGVILDNLDKPIVQKIKLKDEFDPNIETDENKEVKTELKTEVIIQDVEKTRALADAAILQNINEYCDWIIDYSVASGGLGRLGGNKAIRRLKGDESDEGDERGRISKLLGIGKKPDENL
jgi:hypothetical protein